MASNASPGTDALPSTDGRPPRGRDVREDAQDDTTESNTNCPPNHGRVTNSPGAMFLEDADPETPIEDLADRYDEWRRSR